MEKDNYQELLEKYKSRIRKEFGKGAVKPVKQVDSRVYSEFKRELYPNHYSWYEKACNYSESLLKIKADPKKAVKIQKDLDLCHLNVTPSGVTAFSILLPLFVIIFGGLIAYAVFRLPFFVVFFMIAWAIAGVFSVLTVWHPALSGLGGYAWIIGAALGTVLHLMLSGQKSRR